MDILARIEAASAAAGNSHLKQCAPIAAAMTAAATHSHYTGSLGDTGAPPTANEVPPNLAELGAALSVLMNPMGLLPSAGGHQSSAGLFSLMDPSLLLAKFSGQNSAFGANQPSFPSSTCAPPSFLPQSLLPQFAIAQQASLQKTAGNNTPTLADLLTPQCSKKRSVPREGEQQSTTASEAPAAKRAKLNNPSENKGEADNCATSSSMAPSFAFGDSAVASELNLAGNQQQSSAMTTASLLCALSGAAHFPLAATSPPPLPSPPCANKSAQNSPTNSGGVANLGRRLSTTLSTSSSSTTNGMGGLTRTPQRKPATAIPAEKKDEAYYERRRKNNDAAKRSRDTRRIKEELTAQRAAYLEQENIELRTQLGMMRAEIAKYQTILLTAAPPLSALAQQQLVGTPAKQQPKSGNNLVLASPTSTTTNEPCTSANGSDQSAANRDSGLSSAE